MSDANKTQVGGDHYKEDKIQHWDFCFANNYDIFQVYITKYIHRWKRKNGIEDLLKARHALDKYIEEAIKQEQGAAGKGYINQDG